MLDKGCGRGNRACHPHSLLLQSRWEGSLDQGPVRTEPLPHVCLLTSGISAVFPQALSFSEEYCLDQGALLLCSQYQLGLTRDPNRACTLSLILHNHSQPNAPNFSGQLSTCPVSPVSMPEAPLPGQPCHLVVICRTSGLHPDGPGLPFWGDLLNQGVCSGPLSGSYITSWLCSPYNQEMDSILLQCDEVGVPLWAF